MQAGKEEWAKDVCISAAGLRLFNLLLHCESSRSLTCMCKRTLIDQILLGVHTFGTFRCLFGGHLKAFFLGGGGTKRQ